MTSHSEIFTVSGCLTPEAINCYLQQNLPENEQRLVERHLNDCLLCSEAVDGYVLHPESLTEIDNLSGLRDVIVKKPVTDSKKSGIKKGLYPWIGMAASFVLLVIGYFLFNFFLKEPISEMAVKNDNINKNIPLEPQASEEKRMESESKTTTIEQSIQGGVHTEQQKFPYSSNKRADNTYRKEENTNYSYYLESTQKPYAAVVSDKSVSTGFELDSISSVSIYKEDQDVTNGYLKNLNSDDAEFELAQDIVVVAGKQAKDTRKAKSEAEKVTLDSKMNESPITTSGFISGETNPYVLFEKEQYNSALEILKTTVNGTPNDVKATYYLALCYYHLEKKQKALDQLIILGNMPTHAYSEKAYFYQGIIYMDWKENQKAKTALQQVIIMNGELGVQAEEKLKSIR